MDKRVKWGIVVLISAGLIGFAIRTLIPKKSVEPVAGGPVVQPKQKSGSRMLNVNAQVIKPKALTDGIAINGNLLPDEEVDLSFETSGKVVQINFTEGVPVRKGQLLAKVNDLPQQAQLKKLEAQLKLSEDRVFRQDALLKKEAVSLEEYQQAETNLAMLKADIDVVKANIALTELRAPFDGIIGLRQISEGTYASPSTVVAKLTKISPLKVEFAVPERYAGQIKKGTTLKFSVEGDLDLLSATVYATESQVDTETHTLAMRALYPNSNGAILPGRYVNVRLQMKEIPDAIAIPSEAIVPEMGKDKVFLYKSGKAVPVEITKGLRTDSEVQILRGLSVGDTIITSGTLQLRLDLPVSLDQIN